MRPCTEKNPSTRTASSQRSCTAQRRHREKSRLIEHFYEVCTKNDEKRSILYDRKLLHRPISCDCSPKPLPNDSRVVSVGCVVQESPGQRANWMVFSSWLSGLTPLRADAFVVLPAPALPSHCPLGVMTAELNPSVDAATTAHLESGPCA